MPSRRSDEDRITVVDTRDQNPYTFDPRSVAIIRRAVPTGAYSIEGYEDSVGI